MADTALGARLSDTSPALLPGPEPLVGQYVTLERLTPEHISDLYENIGSHDALWTYTRYGPFSTTSDFAHHIHAILADDQGGTSAIYAIIFHGRAVGHIWLTRADVSNRVIEVGHVAFGPVLQRTRAGTEVLYLLGCLVFDRLRYRRWEWKCNSLNVASQRAAERYGFVFEGLFRQHMIF